MECPNCQTENRDTAKFCENCGNRLQIVCPNCARSNRPGAKFCDNCGHKLEMEVKAPAADSPPQSSVSKFIPKELATKLEHARDSRAMEGERRIVTILFCDVKGSTEAAEQLDPEEWTEIINGAFEHMIHPVYKYEGTVARLMGDAVLAFFGAPIAHEDDPKRAVLAGLDILEGMDGYRAQVKGEWGINFDVRVGINTGLVVVGAVGSDLRMEYTAIGDAINLAARMEQTAEPGTIQVAEDTFQLVAPVFEWEDLGEIAVKGKTEPVRIFRPLRRKARPGKPGDIKGLDSPLVGRATELEKLRAAVDRLELGVGGIAFIVGEAGLGKSRLVEELHHSLRTENQFPIAWQETSSLSYETGQAYNLFQRLLRRRWDIPTNAPADTVRERLARQLEDHPGEEGAKLQGVFETLFSVDTVGGSQLEGETFKRELFSAMTVLWKQTQPAVLVCDDLHWADPASIELLLHLFKSTERVSLLVICAMRPDRNRPGWELKEAAARDYPHRYVEIILPPLTSDDTNALIDNLLTIANLPTRLRQRILAKTDGNPFFVEEVVRALIDKKAIVPEGNGGETRWRVAGDINDIKIPGNLQSLLTARIDQLEEDARRTLQLASVIGRSFYYRVLDAINQAITGVHSDLDRQLIALQRGELIREAARVPELEYMFRHSLTQEAAYSTILLRQRREFHRQVGEAIERLFPDRLEEFYPVLAYHFGEANDSRALGYETLAGDAAFRLFAIPEALEHYTRALTHAKLSAESSDTLTHIYLRRGRCQELQSDYSSALQNYAEMGNLAEKRDDQAMLLAALKAQATAYAVPGPAQDAQTGEKLAEWAMALAHQLSDREAEAEILWIFMLLKIHSGFGLEGIPFGEQSAELARELGMRLQLAHSLQDLGLAYLSVGYLDQAVAALTEAHSLWEKLENLPMLVENRARIVYLRVMTVDFEEAISISEEALRIAQSIENVWGEVNARFFVGLVHIARGEIDHSLQTAQSLIADAEKIGHPGKIIGQFYLIWLYNHLGADDLALDAAQRGVETSTSFPPFHPLSLAMLARQRIRAGAWDQAEKPLTQARQSETRQTLQMMDLIIDLVTVEFYLGKRDFPQAEAYLDTLLGKLYDSGARYFLPDVLRLKATSLHEQGADDEALETLREAQTIAEQIESKITLWRILTELGEVDASGEVVDSIAANITSLELRRTFLGHAKSIRELSSRGVN